MRRFGVKLSHFTKLPIRSPNLCAIAAYARANAAPIFSPFSRMRFPTQTQQKQTGIRTLFGG